MLNQLKPQYPMKKGLRPDFKGTMKFFAVLLLITAALPLQAAKYYWVGGSGNWTDLSHWVSTSGGTKQYLTLPGKYDDVIFDANSGFTSTSNVVTLDSTGHCKNMDWSAATNTPVFTDVNAGYFLFVTGNMNLVSGMTFDINTVQIEDLDMWPSYISERFRTINTNGVTFNANLILTGDDHLQFLGNLDLAGNDLFLNANYSIDARNITVTCRNLFANGNAEVDFRNATLVCSEAMTINNANSWYMDGSSVTVSAGISAPFWTEWNNLTVSGSPADAAQNVNVYLPGASINNFTINMASTWTGNMNVSTDWPGTNARHFNVAIANASNNLHFDGDWNVYSTANISATAGKIYFDNGSFDATNGDSTTIGAGTNLFIAPGESVGSSRFILNGTATDTVRVHSTQDGNSASFYATSGYHCFDFVSFKDIDATNGNNLNAPIASDKGNNSGITFAATCGDTVEVFVTNDPSSLSICTGTQFTITYSYYGATLSPSNFFLLERSDDEGNWVGDIIDSKNDSVLGNTLYNGTFTLNMPSLNYNASKNYRFRVRATDLPGSGYSVANPTNVALGYSPYASFSVGNQNVVPGQVVFEGWDFDGLPPFTFSYTDGTAIINATTNELSVREYTTSVSDKSYSILNVYNTCGIGSYGGGYDVDMSNGYQNEAPSATLFGDTTICREYFGGNDYVNVWAMISNVVDPSDYDVYYEDSENGNYNNINMSDFADFVNEYPNESLVAFKPLFIQNENTGGFFDNVSGLIHDVINARPRANLSLAPNQQTTICQGSSTMLQIDFEKGNAPWDVTYDAGGSPITVNGITANPYFLTVSPYSDITYDMNTLFANVTSGTCSSELYANNGSVSVNVQTPATVSLLSGDSSITYCTSTNAGDTFKLEIDIQGGQAPYSVSMFDGTNNFAISNLSGADTVLIPLFPSATTTYTITGISSGGVCPSGQVNAVPVVATVTSFTSLNATLSGTQAICSMTPATLTLAVNGSFPATLVVNHGGMMDTISGIMTSPYHFYVAPTTSTTYSIVSIKNKCGAGTGTGTATVTVNNLPVNAAFNVIPQGNNTFQFINTSVGATSYTWNFGDGTVYTTTTSDTFHTYANAGIYQVTLTASNQCNIQNATQTVSNAVAVDNALEAAEIRVYPNPSNGLFNLEVAGVDQSVNVSIENIQGQVVYQGVVTGNGRMELDIQNQSAGIYMLHLSTEQGRVVRKLIVQ